MSDSVGARLRQARELRRLTLQQVSETTKVRPHYLQALENDDHSAIPSAAQARGFLHLYAEFLELDLADLLATAQPAQPAPSSARAPGPITTTSPGRPSLWSGLRRRLTGRGNKADSAQGLPVSLPEGSGPEAAPLPNLPAERPAPPADQVQPAPASVEVQTKRRAKSAPTDVKKNAVS
jgi:transcriptional regulator with XRE-family HTH domain